MNSYCSKLQARLQAFNRTKTKVFLLPIVDRLNQLGVLYSRVLRLEDVQLAQKNVDNLQEQFVAAQSDRRQLAKQLSLIRNDNARLFNEMRKAKRIEDDDRYIEMFRLEREGRRLEYKVNTDLNNVEEVERDLFTLFSSAIRSSHEKQRIQAQHSKYIGLILTVIGSSMSFLYMQLRKETVLQDINEKFKSIISRLDRQQQKSSSYFSYVSYVDKNIRGIYKYVKKKVWRWPF